jgi:DUF1680 family protein
MGLAIGEKRDLPPDPGTGLITSSMELSPSIFRSVQAASDVLGIKRTELCRRAIRLALDELREDSTLTLDKAQPKKLRQQNEQHEDRLEILRKMRAKRGHHFAQMCAAIGISEAAYRKKMLDNRLDEVIDAYRKVPSRLGAGSGWDQMTDAEMGWAMLQRPKLPPVGTVLENGDAKVKVIRHTGADSILVEWTDAERKTRRAEWTTTPHPRQTDRGTWEAKR